MRLSYIPLFALCFTAACAGCSDSNPFDTAPVTGQVTYKGKPLPYGTVSFRPQAGSPASGKIQPDGTFTLGTYEDQDGAIVGSHVVLITATEADAGAAQVVEAGTEMTVPKSVIPQKYTSFSTSGLTAEVVAGQKNEFTFALED